MMYFYRFYRMIVAIAIVMLSAVAANAAIEVNGLWWEISSDTNRAQLVAKPDGSKYSGDIVVPENITVDEITYEIDPNVSDKLLFNGCPDLTSLVFKSDIGLSNLRSNPRLKKIEWDDAITSARKAPSIVNQGFNGCDSLETIIFPRVMDWDISISYSLNASFEYMSSLKTVKLPENPTVIKANAFYYCDNLSSINLENVTHIGDEAFMHTALESIDLSNAPYLGKYAFYHIGNLTEIVFPDSLSAESGFLKPCTVNGIPYNCTFAFGQNYALTSVKLPKGLTSIPKGCFSGCYSLSDVELPQSLERIEDGAFMKCSSLVSPQFNEGLVYIGNDAFNYTTDLNIPASLEYLGDGNVRPSVTKSVTVAEGNNYFMVKNNALYSKDGKKIYGAIFGSSERDNYTGARVLNDPLVEELGTDSFENLPITDFNFPALKKIGIRAFSSTDISSVRIKKGVEYRDCAFLGCKKLTDVTIEEGVTELSRELFSGCTSLTTAPVLPRSLIKVNDGLFSGCKFTQITLPCNLTYYANNLLPDLINHIVCVNPVPPHTQQLGWGNDYLPNITLEVPLESVDVYKNHSFWGGCKEIIGNAVLSENQPNKSLPHGIYYAVKGGNICYTQDGKTFDTGIASGAHPFNMQYYNNGIYVSDAGENHTYSDTDLNDGKLFVVEHFDDIFTATKIYTEGGHNNDPYTCWIDTITGTLYSCDRMNIVYNIDLNNHNWYPYNSSILIEQWTQLPYYNRGIAYGALSRGIQKDSNGVYWMPFCYSGNGIIRFKDSDIYSSPNFSTPPPYNMIAADKSKITAMYLDEKNGYLYAFSSLTSAHGLYRIALANVESAKSDMSNWELIDNSLASAENTTVDEGVFVRQISGFGDYVYWSYIADETSGNKSGIKRVNATGTPVVEYVVEDVDVYGFAIVPKTNTSTSIESVECAASNNLISIIGNSIIVNADAHISVYDVNGVMQSVNVLSTNNQLDLNLNSGIYIIKAVATDGSNAQFAKIAIK